MIDFQQFKNIVEHAGLQAHDCGGEYRGRFTHWQIKGGFFLVNFWPKSKNGPRYHVAGTVGARNGPVHKAIEAALKGKAGTGHVDRKTDGKYYSQVKSLLLSKQPFCYLCGCKLTKKTATIDHVIPLDKGGSNSQDNLNIACRPCNEKKGNKIIAKKPITRKDNHETAMR